MKDERKFIFIAILALTLFGTLMVYEASSLYSYRVTSDPAHFFKRQLVFSLIGIGLFFLTLMVDIEFLRHYSRWLFPEQRR